LYKTHSQKAELALGNLQNPAFGRNQTPGIRPGFFFYFDRKALIISLAAQTLVPCDNPAPKCVLILPDMLLVEFLIFSTVAEQSSRDSLFIPQS